MDHVPIGVVLFEAKREVPIGNVRYKKEVVSGSLSIVVLFKARERFADVPTQARPVGSWWAV